MPDYILQGIVQDSTGNPTTSSVTITVTTGGSIAPVATVTVSPNLIATKVGGTVQLTAILKDAGGNILTDRLVTWSTSNGNLTVSSTGLITGKSTGHATITATSETKTGVSSVYIIFSTTVTPASATIGAGGTVQLVATLKDSGGGIINSTPPSGSPIVWSSSNSAVATVNSTGLVTGVGNGTTTIKADSGGIAGSAAITVGIVTPVVTTIQITPPSLTLQPGQTSRFTAVVKDQNGNIMTGQVVTWSSSNSAVVTVDSTGLVTAVVNGSGSIIAIVGSVQGTASLTVSAPPVVTIVTVAPTSVSITLGQTTQLTATVRDQNNNVMIGQTVVWSSSNTGVATVNSTGLVTTVAPGNSTITATVGSVSGSSGVAVSQPVISSGTIPQTNHVYVVVEENHDYTDAVANMPYMMSLANQWGLATQFYANTHPSIGNYFFMICGQVITNNDSFSTIVTVDNIIRHINSAGKTWKSYAESIPSQGYLGGDTGQYARKHNTIALLSDVANDPTGQAMNMVPFTQFVTDLANNNLPNFSFIAPNLCNDAHDCSLTTADNWLKTNIDPLVQSAQFKQDGLLIIVFDESASDNTLGGGRITCVLVGPKVKTAFQSGITYQFQSLLRTMMEALGLTNFPGAAATAKSMSDFFQSSGGATITLTGHPRTTSYSNTSLGTSQIIDASNCQFRCPTSVLLPVTLAGGSFNNWRAGEILGSTPPNTSWSTMHDMYAFILKGTTNLIVENALFFDYGDSVSFDSLGNDGFLVRDSLIKYSRDDGLENDFYAAGTIDNCFFDGVYDGVSCQQYASPPNGSAKVVTMSNCLVRLQPMDAAFSGPIPNHNGFWKWASDAPQLKLYNNVFRADSVSQEGPSINMSLFPWPGKQLDASNNVLCWLADSAGPPGEAIPTGWVVLTGQAALDRWNTAVAAWQAAHPYLQTDIHPPICSMFQPGLIGSATLTGTTTLIATAVDDRAVVGVQFKLNGAAIGAEATIPTPYAFSLKSVQNYDRFTKYNLVWDSRTVANGTYTLTAAARDSAGNSTISAGITITVSN